jgi:glutamate/tyrosine decarboxylase-like PLP-dependent enzyme
VSRGEGELLTVPKPRAVSLLSVYLAVKPVGEPDAGDRHVRFDERGWETERCRMAQATAPILDSTFWECRMHRAMSEFEGKAVSAQETTKMLRTINKHKGTLAPPANFEPLDIR